MAIKMVREPSETPNINNIDDIVPMRYAYGNQNGYVIGKGTEISNTVAGLNFTVNSGRLVMQGVECDIDATGVTITIDNIATKRYYTIYLEVNLGLNTATIKDEYDTATYPTIDVGDDLTENTTGVARLPLYRFTATSGIISDVNKVVESVKYTSDMSVANSNTVQNVDFSLDNNAAFGNYVIPKKRLLWTAPSPNPLSISSSYSEDYIDANVGIVLNDNDIIEIEYLSRHGGAMGSVSEFVKINLQDFASSYSTIHYTLLVARGSTLATMRIGFLGDGVIRLWKPNYIVNAASSTGITISLLNITKIIE